MLSLADLENVFDVIDSGLIVINDKRCVRGWNRWMDWATGVGRDQALDRTLEDIFPKAVMGRLSAAVSQALDAG